MDLLQRLQTQKEAYKKSIGVGTYNGVYSMQCSIDGDIDRYIITMIETNDRRRLLLDRKDYNSILDSFTEDARRRIEKELDKLCKL